MSTTPKTYDIIFAGGGTSACVAASVLSAREPSLKILLIEMGPSTKGVADHVQPGQVVKHLVPGSKTVKPYVAKPSEYLGGRSLVVGTGQCVGGGSSVNGMVYNRPTASELDDWKILYGNDGWDFAHLLPLFIKAEDYSGVNPTAGNKHGYSGPLKISYGGSYNEAAANFVDIGPKYMKARVAGEESNGFDSSSINVFTHAPKYIDSAGQRSDVAHSYVYKAESATNLEILDSTWVEKILFDGTRAIGVQINKSDNGSDTAQLLASKLVVVSSGAFGTPGLLERSGIGAKSVLDRARVPVLVDLPGVGENYKDHLMTAFPYIVADSVETYDPLFRGEPAAWQKWMERWYKDGKGLLGNNGTDAIVKIRPDANELKEIGPAFAPHWAEKLQGYTDRPLFWLSASAGMLSDQSQLKPAGYVSAASHLSWPSSVGYIHITSTAKDSVPDFDAGFLNQPSDIVAIRWIYKKGRELIRRLPAFRGAVASAHPTFPQGSEAANMESSPVAISAPDIKYTAEDDAAIDEFVRKTVTTTWHSMGTAAMKGRSTGGVVDQRLNVYGVSNLKVADMSIAPGNVSANTYSTAVVIGEKAAILIAEDLGLKHV